MSSADKNSSNNIPVPQKYLDKILKLQQDQDKSRQEEFILLQQHLAQMNQILIDTAKISESSANTAYGKKYIPFDTGSVTVNLVQQTKPANPDDYAVIINIYAQNGSRPIEHMTLINDGAGTIFFIVAHSKTDLNNREGLLNVNDQRELFNVYEVRLRVTLPLTSFRLMEGTFRTGSFSPFTKANVEIRPTLQANEIGKLFTLTCDNFVPTITITVPTIQTFAADYSITGIQSPLPPGATAALIDSSTGMPMPFTIPEGFIFESFVLFANASTDFTARNYFEVVLGSDVFSLTTVFPMNNRGNAINATFNISEFSSVLLDPNGAPPGGRRVLLTMTNDDPFNNMIGDIDLFVTLRRLT